MRFQCYWKWRKLFGTIGNLVTLFPKWKINCKFNQTLLGEFFNLNDYNDSYHHQVTQLAQISITHSHHSSLSSITPGWSSRLHPVSIQCCCKFLLASQHWHVHVKGLKGECHLWVRPCFSSSVPHALFILFGWLVVWFILRISTFFRWFNTELSHFDKSFKQFS